MTDVWLPSLQTDTPQAGFELAVKLSRMGVKLTQPSDQVRSHLRAAYEQDSAQLMRPPPMSLPCTSKRSPPPTTGGGRRGRAYRNGRAHFGMRYSRSAPLTI